MSKFGGVLQISLGISAITLIEFAVFLGRLANAVRSDQSERQRRIKH